eukprot:781051-Amphidinium_carterae.1
MTDPGVPDSIVTMSARSTCVRKKVVVAEQTHRTTGTTLVLGRQRCARQDDVGSNGLAPRKSHDKD